MIRLTLLLTAAIVAVSLYVDRPSLADSHGTIIVTQLTISIPVQEQSGF